MVFYYFLEALNTNEITYKLLEFYSSKKSQLKQKDSRNI